MDESPAPADFWDPLDLRKAVEVFEGAPFRWWISGGLALELHLGTSWRSHEDTDVGVCRSDLNVVYSWLSDWDMHVAAGGVLTRWDGGWLDPSRGQNNVWLRKGSDSLWLIDLTVSEGDTHQWLYRRGLSLARSWDETVLFTHDLVPYLAPDLQLLFKSKDPRPKDDTDARIVIPALTTKQSRFLLANLEPEHPWRSHLADRLSST